MFTAIESHDIFDDPFSRDVIGVADNDGLVIDTSSGDLVVRDLEFERLLCTIDWNEAKGMSSPSTARSLASQETRESGSVSAVLIPLSTASLSVLSRKPTAKRAKRAKKATRSLAANTVKPARRKSTPAVGKAKAKATATTPTPTVSVVSSLTPSTSSCSLSSSVSAPSRATTPPPPPRELPPLLYLLHPEDPRLHFVKQYAKVWNFCDLRLRQMLLDSCTSEVLLLSQYLGAAICSYGCNYLEVHGLEAMISFFRSLMSAMPDLVFSFRTPRLQASYAEYTAIATDFTIVATKTLSLASDGNCVLIKAAPVPAGEGVLVFPLKNAPQTAPFQPQQSQGINDNNNNNANNNTISDNTISDIGVNNNNSSSSRNEESEPSDRLLLGVRPLASRCSISGSFTYFLNNENKVFKIEFRHQGALKSTTG